MKKLKQILQSNIFYITIFLILVIYVFFLTKIKIYHSKFSDGQNILLGKVESFSKEKDKYNILINGIEKVKLTYYAKEDLSLAIGMNIKVEAELKSPSKSTIPNIFNYQKYLYNQKIYKVGTITKFIEVKSDINWFEKIKNFMYQRSYSNKYLSMFIVGDKSFLEDDVYSAYKNIGIGHLLAISGMHVGVLILIINKLFFFISEKYRNYLTIMIVAFYAYVVNYSASILRVLFCFIFNLINKKLNLSISSGKVLLLVAMLMLFYNPFYIYNVNFLYSFLCSLSIILAKKFLKNNYIINTLKITFFALLFTLPITVSLNYEINLLTFLSNLIFIPYLTYFLYPLSLIAFCVPFFEIVFDFFAQLMEKCVLFFDTFDFFVLNIPKLNFIFVVIYYIFTILFIYYGYKRFFILIILLVCMFKFSFKLDNKYQLIFFDVGQGDCLVIIFPYQKKVVMIDTGGNYNYKVSNSVTLYLKSIGINKLETMIISHGDYDHMGEAINLVNNFKVEKVILNCGEFNELEQNLIKVLDNKNIKYYSCIKELNINKNKLYFLKTRDYGNENDNSSVIYAELDNHKFLFMGDAGVEVENDLIEKYNLQDIDVLKVGHHGSKTSSSKELIEEINPKYSIISVSKNNRYGHPNKEVLKNLEDSKIYRTDQDGSIMFKIKNNKLEIETCSP